MLAGDGNDLFLSTSICDGELLSGGAGRDNSSWARLRATGSRPGSTPSLPRSAASAPPAIPVAAAKSPTRWSGSRTWRAPNSPTCWSATAARTSCSGTGSPDEYFALGGDDSILANSSDSDLVINCGADVDKATIDIPSEQFADPTPIECETVKQGGFEDFRTATELPPPPLPPAPPVPSPRVDRKPPRTKMIRRPAGRLSTARKWRRLVFRFASNERGSRFRCKLDSKPYRGCRSPRVFHLRPGRHVVRIFAIDAAGNRDRSPAVMRFRIIRRR